MAAKTWADGAWTGTTGAAKAGWVSVSYHQPGLPHSVVISGQSDFLHGGWLLPDRAFQGTEIGSCQSLKVHA